jgi:hypothetical protein
VRKNFKRYCSLSKDFTPMEVLVLDLNIAVIPVSSLRRLLKVD